MKISEMSNVAAQAADQIPVVRGGQNLRVDASTVAALAPPVAAAPVPIHHQFNEVEIGHANGEFYFYVPAGALTMNVRYIVGSATLGDAWTMRVYRDPFVSFALLSTVAVPISSSNAVFNTGPLAVTPGDLIMLYRPESINQPAAKVFAIVTFA